MSKLLLATVSIVLVVFVTANKDTEGKNTDLSIQTNLLTRKVREADTKRAKKKNIRKRNDRKKKRAKKNQAGTKKSKKKSRNKHKNLNGHKREKAKKRKARKRRKLGKRLRVGKRRNKKGREDESTPPSLQMCLEDVQTALDARGGAANNFKSKQSGRIERQIGVMKNKFEKSGDFAGIRAAIVVVGGGNANALECQGSATSTVAESITTLAENLDKCNMNIQTDCNSQGLVDQTALEKCQKTVDTFITDTMTCSEETPIGGSKACMCWETLVKGNVIKEVKACAKEFATVAKIVKEKNAKCKTTFKTCRGYEDDSAIKIAACLQSTAKLEEKAKVLSANKDAVTKASAKINSVAGIGSNTTGRVRRAISSCAEFVKAVKELIKLSPDNSSVATSATKIAEASVTCSAAEKAVLVELSVSVGKFSKDIDEQLTAVQTAIKEATGSTVNPASVTSSTSTKAARFRRSFDEKKFKLV